MKNALNRWKQEMYVFIYTKRYLIIDNRSIIYIIRQCHFLGEQNRTEDGDEEVHSHDEEGQHVLQSLSPD